MALDRLAQLAVDIVVNARRAKAQLANFRGAVNANTKAIKGFGAGLGTIGLAASGFLILRRALRLLSDTIKLSVRNFAELETQITNVAKVGNIKNIDKLADSFFDITESARGSRFKDTSTAMVSAARAGVSLGAGLEELTTAALRLKASSLDISAKDAAEGLAALSINMKQPLKEVAALASSIDALSDNFLTNSGEILKTSARLSGFASAAGLTVIELNALSAALLSTKISPTVIRTSITKLLTAFEAAPKKVAETIGLVGDAVTEFGVKVRSGQADDALKLFIDQLNKLQPEEQAAALKSLGLSSSRVLSVMKLLQISQGELQKALKLSRQEYIDGDTSLLKGIKTFDNTNNKIIALENSWKAFTASLIDNRAVLNIVIGTLKQLENFVGTGVKFDLGDISDLDNIDGVNKRLAELRQRLKNIGIEIKNKFGTQKAVVFALATPTAALAIAALVRLQVDKNKLIGEELEIKRLIKQLEEQITNLKGAQRREAELALNEAKKLAKEKELEKENTSRLLREQVLANKESVQSTVNEILGRKELLALEEKRAKVAFEEAQFAATAIKKSGLPDTPHTRSSFKPGGDAETQALRDLRNTLEKLDRQIADLKALPSLQRAAILADLGGDQLASQLMNLDIQAMKLAETFKNASDAEKEKLKTALASKRAAIKRDDALSRVDSFTGGLSDPVATALKFAESLEKTKSPEEFANLRSLYLKEFINKNFGKIQKPEFTGLTEVWKKAVIGAGDKEDAIAKEHLAMAKQQVMLTVRNAVIRQQILDKLDQIAADSGLRIR